VINIEFNRFDLLIHIVDSDEHKDIVDHVTENRHEDPELVPRLESGVLSGCNLRVDINAKEPGVEGHKDKAIQE